MMTGAAHVTEASDTAVATDASAEGRRRSRATAALVVGALAVGAIGCSSTPDQSVGTEGGGASNPTTASGEGAGGGPAPDASSTSTTSTAAIPGGTSVSVTGTLSGVRTSPDSKIKTCTYLTTPEGVFALEVTERQYTIIANVEPVQLEIKDAKTKSAVAKLGQSVAVEGISHPDPTPVGGASYRCEGATAYLKATSIKPTP